MLKMEYKTSDEAAQPDTGSHQVFLRDVLSRSVEEPGGGHRAGSQDRTGGLQSQRFSRTESELGNVPNNLGHTDFPGCFRCHDGEHSSSDQNTITQDCAVCHETVSVAETSPEILKTLGLADRIAAIQKK